jgi:FkbM family methyltransferase
MLKNDNPAKNILRCAYYNLFRNFGFHSSYRNGHFILKNKVSGVTFKTFFNPYWNELDSVLKYFDEHTPAEGDVVVDAGAFFGLFSIYAAKIVGEKGKVYAFEPDKVNYKELLRNIELNSLKNVTALNTGLWNAPGELTFYSNGVFSSFLEGQTDTHNALKSPVTSLDIFFSKAGDVKPSFIKMDIEGGELEAVKGAQKTLKEHPVKLAIASYHKVNGEPSYIKLEKILGEMGFETRTDRSTPHLVTYARKGNQ